jgi:lipoate---protein ligase
MKYLDLTLDTPEANLALDEALLDFCEAGALGGVLRVWEAPQLFVVAGYGNHVAREVNVDACQKRGVPILRRCTGGGTVLQGPGCLSYALVLDIELAPELSSITGTNTFVMGKHRDLFRRLFDPDIEAQGHTDLALRGKKFSGNAQRRRRSFILFHGTFLLGFNLSTVEELLSLPSKQPDYRMNRGHADFLRNLDLSPAVAKSGLRDLWQASDTQQKMPGAEVERLVCEKYSRMEWTWKF